MAQNIPIQLRKNGSFIKRFRVFKNGVPLNLAGVAADFRLKSAIVDTTVYATWTTGGGQITTNASGYVLVKVNTATVTALPAGVQFQYVARLTGYDADIAANSAGFDEVFAEGDVTVTEDP